MATRAAAKKGKKTTTAQNEANPASNLTDNSVSASEMAAKLPDSGEKGKSLLAADASTADRMAGETADEQAEVDNSVYGRLARSGYVLNDPQGSNDRWIGESIQKTADPARMHLKTNCKVTPISDVSPFTGLRVEPIGGGEPFAVPEEFGGKGATPATWLALIDPATGKPFIEA